jgi:hypothetical protein
MLSLGNRSASHADEAEDAVGMVDDQHAADEGAPVVPHDEGPLDAEARHQLGRLPGDVTPVVVGIVELGAAVALEVDRDQAIGLVHERQDVVPGIPALRQAMNEQDHLALRCPRLDVVPAYAVDDPIVVVVRRVDRIVGCLEVRPAGYIPPAPEG